MSTRSHDQVESVVLRLATVADDPALRRLAELDSRPLPQGQLMIAEVDGELRAAYSALERSGLADPFRPTAHLVELLGAHATQREPATRAAPWRVLGVARRAPWPA